MSQDPPRRTFLQVAGSAILALIAGCTTDENPTPSPTPAGTSRDRAFTYALYETAARSGELLGCSIGDFTSNEKGDFIYLEGLKDTPYRTNQLVRSGRPLREWIAHTH